MCSNCVGCKNQSVVHGTMFRGVCASSYVVHFQARSGAISACVRCVCALTLRRADSSATGSLMSVDATAFSIIILFTPGGCDFDVRHPRSPHDSSRCRQKHTMCHVSNLPYFAWWITFSSNLGGCDRGDGKASLHTIFVIVHPSLSM